MWSWNETKVPKCELLYLPHDSTYEFQTSYIDNRRSYAWFHDNRFRDAMSCDPGMRSYMKCISCNFLYFSIKQKCVFYTKTNQRWPSVSTGTINNIHSLFRPICPRVATPFRIDLRICKSVLKGRVADRASYRDGAEGKHLEKNFTSILVFRPVFRVHFIVFFWYISVTFLFTPFVLLSHLSVGSSMRDVYLINILLSFVV